VRWWNKKYVCEKCLLKFIREEVAADFEFDSQRENNRFHPSDPEQYHDDALRRGGRRIDE